MRKRVGRAHEIQAARFGSRTALHANAHMGIRELDRYCLIDEESKKLLSRSVARLGLSARACHKILKLARTIADLAAEEAIGSAHLAEAIQYRRSDVARSPLSVT